MTKEPTSHITPGHVRALQLVTSPLHRDNISLISCFINGEPGVAIVYAEFIDDDRIGFAPLFVAITPGMEIRIPGEEEDSDDDGGPRRNVREEFIRNRASFAPQRAPG